MKPSLHRSLHRFRGLFKPLAPPIGAPLPHSPWQIAIEQRLLAIEQRINSQNRLILLAILTALTDIILRLLK